MSTLRKNVASQKFPFQLLASADGSALTGATVTATISKDGAARATATGTVAELAGGQYVWSPAQADTNCNSLGVQFTATDAIPVHFTIFPTAADPTDSVRMGLTALPNAAAGASGGLPTGDASGRVTVGSTATTERSAIADAILDRDMSTGTDSGSPSVRTMRQALRMNRNKVVISGTTLTVYKEDDTTSSWTADLTVDSAAAPITAVDPA